MGDELDKIFDSFDKNSIFKDKSFLQSNYTPNDIPHREKEIQQIASILAPVLRGEKTSNLFLYGNTGTGKTLSIFKVQEALEKRMQRNSDSKFELKIQYLNCKLKQVADTEYRILAEIIKQLGGEVPATGLPTQAVYSKFIEMIEGKKQLVVLILDEVDQLVKKISNNFLYNLTRLNSELSRSQISLVGISNDLTFLENIDPRVKSSLSEEEIVFSPYNALQIQDILVKRVGGAFKSGVLEGGVVAKCAAYAARESGDARRALDLLRVAGELAERAGEKKVTIKHIDEAKGKIERDKILDLVSNHPRQFQTVLNSIISISEEKKGYPFFTGEVYSHYQRFCRQYKVEPLTQRRVGDIIQEFDMLGILNVRVISKGRGGRMREIKLGLSDPLLEKVKEVISLGLSYA
ncbi:MAG: orc1/cdc6 family replication initiation protein [archaeon]|nr:orc1/cdc6 family replication initiation protein [archaeon]